MVICLVRAYVIQDQCPDPEEEEEEEEDKKRCKKRKGQSSLLFVSVNFDLNNRFKLDLVIIITSYASTQLKIEQLLNNRAGAG